MNESINAIYKKIGRKNEELAEIFRRISGALSENQFRNDEQTDDKQSKPDKFEKDLKKKAKKAVSDATAGTQINLYPSEVKGDCHPECVCYAFGKWNSYKTGFKGVAKYLSEKYMINCKKINQSILILSFSWDEIDFLERYKKIFDDYTNKGKTICVVLITTEGDSIQYLR
jgi:hypothetical protein